MAGVARAQPGELARVAENIDWLKAFPFLGVHVACLGVFWTGVSWKAISLCLALYVLRMFGITAGYHRYFAHRSYRTSRLLQFVLALIGCCALQKGPLWWAAHHRHHHQHSDQPDDVHSPKHRGLWWAHLGWILSSRYNATNFEQMKDFRKYPELIWLNHHYTLPGVGLAFLCLCGMGWPGLVWGFFVSTVLVYHGTFAINSLCHVFGRVRYRTEDASRNSLVLALITLGEGWHNNHHHYCTSANMGFYWWEIDISYYCLLLLSWLGLVWDLKEPSQRALEAAQR